MSALAFPAIAPAVEPPEARGRSRRDVALLVATRSDGAVAAARFADLPGLLRPGDLLVVEHLRDRARRAARPARRRRRPRAPLDAAGRGSLGRRAPHRGAGPDAAGAGRRTRRAARRRPAGAARALPRQRAAARGAPALPCETAAYLALHGEPIRYADHGEPWPLRAYSTIFGREPGSAEMPSAGRPFTHDLVTALVTRGVLVAPVAAPRGRVVARARRAAVPRALPGPARDGAARGRRARLGRPGRRGRHDGRPRAGESRSGGGARTRAGPTS